MSMYPQAIGTIPAETARVARAACPKGTLAMRLRDALGELYQDQDFVALYPPEGQPAYAPWRLAVVTVLQYVENLSDRQAANAVRERIDWKYALGLDLTDPGFDYSRLVAFRTRLVNGQAEARLVDRLLELCKQRGWRNRGRQAAYRFDPCAGTCAFLEQSRMRGRNAACGPQRVFPPWPPTGWSSRSIQTGLSACRHRVENYRLPKQESQRAALARASRYGRTACAAGSRALRCPWRSEGAS
jgi:transposase